MKITQMFNSKFISSFLVLAGITLAPVTGSANSHNTAYTSSFGAPIFVNTEAGVQLNNDVKKPTMIYIGTRKEKGVLHKDLVSKSKIDFRNANDCPGFKDGNYLINIYNSKNSEAKSFTVTCMDSWETPVSKTGKTQ